MRYFLGVAHEQFPAQELPKQAVENVALGTAVTPPGPRYHPLREVEKLGATTMNLMNVSGADPRKAIEVYGGKVLPALAKAPVR